MKIGLGTAQFGLDYGVSNKSGKIPLVEVRPILEAATHSGISIIDTASGYGNSEEVLGLSWPTTHNFKVITKTPRLMGPESHAMVERFLLKSLQNLRLDSVYGLLVHNVDDLLSAQGSSIVNQLQHLKEQGVVKKIGFSVYTGRQIDAALKLFTPDLVQLPLNIFDQRLLVSGHLLLLKKLGVEVHVRSAFLQGLLLMAPEQLAPYFDPYRNLIREYRLFVNREGITPVQAALGFVSSIPEVDSVICGIDSLRHLEEIRSAATTRINTDFGQFAITDEALIDPSRWKVV